MARPTLRSNRKFKRLQRILSLPEPYAWGLLEMLWSVAYETGDPFIGDSIDVETACGWPGESGACTKALLEAGGDGQSGFIELVDANPGEDANLHQAKYRVHDLFDHAPSYVKKRATKETERQVSGAELAESISAKRSAAANERWKRARAKTLDANDNAKCIQPMQKNLPPLGAPLGAPLGEGASDVLHGGGNGKDHPQPTLLEIPILPPVPRPKPKVTPTRFDITLTTGETWNVPESIVSVFYHEVRADGSIEHPLETMTMEETDSALADLVRKSAVDPKHRPTPKGAAAKVTNWLTNAIKFRNRDAEKSAGGHR